MTDMSVDDAIQYVQEAISKAITRPIAAAPESQRLVIQRTVEDYIAGLAAAPFDAQICASDLRALGATLDERIPDCAWVPAAAVHFEPGESKIEGDQFHMNMQVRFELPFQWVEVAAIVMPNPRAAARKVWPEALFTEVDPNHLEIRVPAEKLEEVRAAVEPHRTMGTRIDCLALEPSQ
jgi:hypothetical protein